MFLILPVLLFDCAGVTDKGKKKNTAAATEEISSMGSGHQSKLKDGFWLATL